jgi:SAM-dependent methyltransferase
MSDGSASSGDAVRVDLGCGSAKRPGYIGLDYVDAPGVDHVLDLTEDAYPFADDSVDEVFSAHFLEHVTAPNHVLMEVGRICRDGAHIEIWTPYAFSNEAFLYGHAAFLTETLWYHFCVSHRDVFIEMLRGRWQLNHVTFVINPNVAGELLSHGVPLDFAVKYHKGVVEEFGVDITYRADLDAPVVPPRRLWAHDRFGEAHELVPAAPEEPQPEPQPLGRRLRGLVPEPIKAPMRSLLRR